MTEEILSESFNIKIEKDIIHGINAPEFDDTDIKLFSYQRTFYTCSKIDDKRTLVVGVSMVTGKVTIAVSKIPQIEGAMRSGILDRRESYIAGLKLMPLAINLLYRILDKYKARIKELVFVARDDIAVRYYSRLFKNGAFRTIMSRFRYKLDKFQEEHVNSDDTKVIVFTLTRDKKPEDKKDGS